MIFADKLTALRKKSGWSQEELAELMHVSRQAVSKWEGAQSIPDLDKIIRLSELFGVSTDYLLKDELEQTEAVPTPEQSSLRRVSMEEANAFLAANGRNAEKMAAGVSLCILSPVPLLYLGALSEAKQALPEGVAGGIGLCLLLGMIAVAVALFLFCGSQVSDYQYLEKELIETEYGVDGLVRQRQRAYRSQYTASNIIGTCLCILSAVPLFVGAMIDDDNDLLLVGMVCLLLMIVSTAVFAFVRAGTVWEGFQKLLQEGDYTCEKKREPHSLSGVAATVYWLTAAAVYLTVSYLTKDWGRTWLIPAVAGVLFPALLAIVRLIEGRWKAKNQRSMEKNL